ncbi:MAG TPA: hypothetical protein VGD78_04270 [Chthoniobacterales bacterium]
MGEGKLPKKLNRVIRVTFDSPPDPDRFSRKERCHFAVVVLYPIEVKRQLRTVEAAFAQAQEIARRQIEARLYKPPDLDALETSVEVVMLDLSPWTEVHRTLDDGTKVWLTEAERWHQPW